jgi:hypothetical protein
MTNKSMAYKFKPLVNGGIIVAVFLILRLVLPQVLSPVWTDIAKFYTIFFAILFAFIFVIAFSMRLLGGVVSPRLHSTILLILVAGIVLGVLGMFQPWTLVLFRYGFFLLFVSLFSFMLWSHVQPRTASQEQEPNLQEMLATGLVSPLEDLAERG